MSDYDNAIFRLATAQEAEPEDYTGEDGLLYCGSCRQPKEAYFPEGKTFWKPATGNTSTGRKWNG